MLTTKKIKLWIFNHKILLIILVLAAFSRYYHFWQLQYFQEDESIFYTILHKMASEKSLVFVTPNATTGLHLGPFFHWLSLPFYLLTSGNPLILGLLAPLWAIATTILVYLSAKAIYNRNTGYLAALLYAVSFQASLHDRRYWTLGPDAFFIAASIYSLIQVLKKRLQYLLPLMVCLSFSWHSDFSLAVIPISLLIIFLIYRPKLTLKKTFPSLIYLLISVLPVCFFELKYHFQIIHVIKEMFSRFQVKVSASFFDIFWLAIQNYTRLFFTSASNHIESYYQYEHFYPNPPFSPLSTMLIFVILVVAVIYTIKRIKYYPLAKILLIYWLVFIIGNIYYSYRMGQSFYQHYYMVIAPVIFILFSFGLMTLLRFKSIFIPLVYIFIALIILFNIHALINSKLTHPLFQKIAAAKKALALVKNTPVAFDAVDIKGGGLIYLLDKENVQIIKSDSHDAWYWVYASYSLFTRPMVATWPELVLIFSDSAKPLPLQENEIKRIPGNGIDIIMIDNSSGDFRPIS